MNFGRLSMSLIGSVLQRRWIAIAVDGVICAGEACQP
jgi:hypothetical protein